MDINLTFETSTTSVGLVSSDPGFGEKKIQMLVKKRLLLEHIPGLQNPSDGLTKSFKTRDMLINLEKEVGLVPGLDTNGLSWIRTFQRRLQLLAEEGEMSGIAGDRLESSLLLLKGFVPSYSCHLHCSFVANRRMWTLSTVKI